MPLRRLLQLPALLALAAWANIAAAHEGHGLAGTHWHATDTWGLLAVAGLATLALWLSRSGK